MVNMAHTHSHESHDTNAEIWKSADVVKNWVAEADAREQRRILHREHLAELLAFDEDRTFTFLDLGAGTGAASQAILNRYPNSSAILADFSTEMMAEGAKALAPFEGRYRFVEFDMSGAAWPADIPEGLDAVVTSMCIHHLPDDRKQSLFGEIRERLVPGGWYFNYDPVEAADPSIDALWNRINDRNDPDEARIRTNPTPEERARRENHVRYLIPLEPQLTFMRKAGFAGVEVYWRHLDLVIYGGFRPA